MNKEIDFKDGSKTVRHDDVSSESKITGKIADEPRPETFSSLTGVPEGKFVEELHKPTGIQLNWSKLPKEAMWVAMDEDGTGSWFQGEPKIDRGSNRWSHIGWRPYYLISRKDFTYSGDWKDSLTPRPEETGEPPECPLCGLATYTQPCPRCGGPKLVRPKPTESELFEAWWWTFRNEHYLHYGPVALEKLRTKYHVGWMARAELIK